MALLGLSTTVLLPSLAVAIVVWLAYRLYQHAYVTDIPFIRGIPEPPGSVPFHGHLKALGKDHATQLQEWAVVNNWPVFQVKFGSRRMLVLNTFDSAQHFISKNASATIDRPLFYTFHQVLSKTQGGTIGTSPWDLSCKRRRTAVGAIMTRPAVQKSATLFDLEIAALVKDMRSTALCRENTNGPSVELDPRIYFQRLALNLTLMMCYCTRIDDLTDPLLHELLRLANSISTFRSTNNNIQDWVELYRYLPKNERTKLAETNKNRRDVILDQLLVKVENAMKLGRPVPCLSEGLIQEKGSLKLSDAEIRSVNVSLVSGGFETLSTTGSAGLGYLASAKGQVFQQTAYDAIMQTYSTPEEAWARCLYEETVPAVVALVREMLRYYTPIQLLPIRQTLSPVQYDGATVPEKVGIFQNAQAINHDKTAYGPDADKFRPERWLVEDPEFKVGLPYHYSFGAGSRMCTAVALSNRVLYALFLRLVLHFEFTASETTPPTTDYVDINEDRTGQTVMVKPYKISLKERWSKDVLDENLQASARRTKDVPVF